MSSGVLQVVNQEGKFDPKLDPDLPQSELHKLYRTMIYTRVFDNRMIALQRQGRMSFYAPCVGEEAAHVGSAYALKPEDWLFPQYREQGAMILRGIPLEQLVSSLFGNRNDVCKGRNFANAWGDRSLNIVNSSAPVGTQIPLAVGAAMAAKYKGDKIVTLAYFGDGSTSSGYFHVGLTFASVFKAPTIFFCKNNQYAVSVPTQRQLGSENIAVKAAGYGMEGVQVDGNDILAVYRVTKDAVERARNGEGPTLIEAITYRIGPHSTSDDPSRYRSQEEVESWKRKDPIKRLRLYLENRGLWGEKEEADLWKEAEDMVSEAVRKAEAAPLPTVESMFEDVYKEMSTALKEQLQDALTFHEWG
ncbi:MAG: pyruvate dehydrogenase (acetyl-transferring) E1 component subunit alpha [Thaumarchaeota archaeon]|nr:pyruvate dehydrogenase (acetyl-transferring) E1 component subunit alpha [Nitrososphaerota archaeon]